jgi:hypothetical protein
MALRSVRLAGMALAALGCLALPVRATAQESNAKADAANRAALEAWFREYIEPGLSKLALNDEGEGLTVPLAPPQAPSSGLPGNATPHRLGEVGSFGVLVVDPDVPQQRGEWNDDIHPQMFRIYFEPVAAASH